VHDANDPCEPGAAPAALTLSDGRFRVGDEDLGPTSAVRVPGRFQHANVLVALAAARHLGVPSKELVRLVPTLVGLPHRVEDLGVRAGVRVIDNGVSTTPDSTVAALAGLPEGPLTVLLGGAAKRDLPLDELARTLAARGALAVVFGAASEALMSAFTAAGARVERASDARTAAEVGLAGTPQGGTLLFSPACASFDAWPNFEARARAFRLSLPPEDAGPPPGDRARASDSDR
jgi:UDP-N-acetylmuramoylalanine--D-glutamate ligase